MKLRKIIYSTDVYFGWFKSNYKCHQWSAPSTVITTSPSCFQHLLTLQEIISGIWAPSSMQSHHIKGLQIQLKTGYPFGTDVEYWIQNQEPFVPLREANCLVDVFFCCYWWIVLVWVVSILVAGANFGSCIMFLHRFFWTKPMTSNNPSPNLKWYVTRGNPPRLLFSQVGEGSILHTVWWDRG